MIDPEIIDGLKERYKEVHPFVFHRSVERAETAGELFDILETIPDSFPFVWSEELRCWEKTNDLFQKARLKLIVGK